MTILAACGPVAEGNDAHPRGEDPRRPSWIADAPGPPSVSVGQIVRDPQAAAEQAIVHHDWRPYLTRPFGPRTLDGLDCSFPPEVLDWVTVSRTISDVPPGSPTDRVSLAPYNRALLVSEGSPLAGLCVPGAGRIDWVQADGRARDRRRDWALLGPLPARPAASLLEAARWGRADETATFEIDGALPRDMFHMNALGWAVVRGDRVLVERIMAARPDNRAWCEIELHRGSSQLPTVVAATDPLNLAASAGRTDLLALIAPRFSQGACRSPRGYHQLHRSAMATALRRGDDASVRILVAHEGPMDHDRRAAAAEELLEAGFDALAADLYYAGAQRESDHPLARATERCESRRIAFWAAASLARGRRDDLAYAWAYFQRSEPSAGIGSTDDVDCTAMIDFYRGQGFAIEAGSSLLHRVIQHDRTSPSRASPADARRFLAAYLRAGGALDIVGPGHCPRDPRDAHSNYCTPGELARAGPGETAFAALLPAGRPLVERLIGNARAAGAERYMEAVRNEARPLGCLISLADPAIRGRTRACLARGGAPRFEK